MAVSIVLQAAGPLPVSGKFSIPATAEGAVMMVYGSAWTQTTATMIGVNISLNGNSTNKTATLFANTVSDHKALVPGAVEIVDDAGGDEVSYLVELTALNSTTLTDANDNFLVVIHT